MIRSVTRTGQVVLIDHGRIVPLKESDMLTFSDLPETGRKWKIY